MASFAETLSSLHLLTPEQVEQLQTIEPHFPDRAALARELVRRGWLTRFQANKVLRGKGKDLVVGAYRLIERLGEGGMGEVFKAVQIHLSRLAAVKVLASEWGEQTIPLQRFRREIRTVAKQSHPNIVMVYDADEVDGKRYLAMEYHEGTDLRQLVRQSGPLSISQACECARQACLGLQHAHDQGVVHRDVKPGNLFLSSTESRDTIRILDFGLASVSSERNEGNRLTRMGRVLGTVDYVSPEQVKNPGNVDPRSDVYSLGCSLFYLLTGRPPFLQPNRIDRLMARMVDSPPAVREHRPEIPEALDDLVRKMMARDPDQRFSSPRELVPELAKFCSPGGPPSAVPLPSPQLTTNPGETENTEEQTTEDAALSQTGTSSRAFRRVLILGVVAAVLLSLAAYWWGGTSGSSAQAATLRLRLNETEVTFLVDGEDVKSPDPGRRWIRTDFSRAGTTLTAGSQARL